MACDDCGKRFKDESAIMVLDRANKRLIGIIIALVILWFSTIGLFVYYLNQYDFVGFDYEQKGEGVNIIGNRNGVEYYGATDEGEGAD